MELAGNGDLFDKIEADVGVGEDISHLYFSQLMSAVGYMHSTSIIQIGLLSYFQP